MNSRVNMIRRALDTDAHEALAALLALEAERAGAMSAAVFFERENERLQRELATRLPNQYVMNRRAER